MSEYFTKLDLLTQERYVDKTKLSYPDIVNYLIYNPGR